jgi:hypothetical protein
MIGVRNRVLPALLLVLSSVGFALDGPTGLVVGGLVALSGVLTWPLPFVLGQIAAAAIFTDPGLSLSFALVQIGLWAALIVSLRDSQPGLTPRALAIAGVFTATLLAGTVIWYQSRPMGVTGGVVVVVAVGLYTVHRYEQVTAGLVER